MGVSCSFCPDPELPHELEYGLVGAVFDDGLLVLEVRRPSAVLIAVCRAMAPSSLPLAGTKCVFVHVLSRPATPCFVSARQRLCCRADLESSALATRPALHFRFPSLHSPRRDLHFQLQRSRACW